MYPNESAIVCKTTVYSQGEFYRATVTSLSGSRLNVLFVDYGNSDTVDWYDFLSQQLSDGTELMKNGTI